MRFLACFAVLGLVSAALPRGDVDFIEEPEEPVKEVNNAQDVEQAFINYSLGDVLPDLPNELLTLRFGSEQVLLGNEICPYRIPLYPYVSYFGNPRSMYTLICVNPDIGYYFNGTFSASYLVYLVVNIPGTNVNDGDVLSVYKAALPPPGTGLTRNVCLAYRQARRITITAELILSITLNSNCFDLGNFLTQNRLGSPIAGNFYLTRLILCDKIRPNCRDCSKNRI